MRVLVLGATGKTGGAVVAQALARGHSVTTFGRSPFTGPANDKLRNVLGDPTRADAIATSSRGQDAVLSVLGTRGVGATTLLDQTSRATIAAMRQSGARRLIILSSALLDSNNGPISRFLARTLLRHHARDQRAMEEQVSESDLDWTVFRPTRMSDSAPAGSVISTTESAGRANETLISKDEVARVMLETMESGAYARQTVHLRGGQ